MNERLRQFKWYFLASEVITLSLLLTAAAKPAVRKEVRERASGFCEGCGVPFNGASGIVAHMDHSSGETYNDPRNLKHYCERCETEHHVKHVFSPERIGMSEPNNSSIAWGHLRLLLPIDLDYLTSNYPKEIAYLRNRYRDSTLER